MTFVLIVLAFVVVGLGALMLAMNTGGSPQKKAEDHLKKTNAPLKPARRSIKK